MPRVEWTDSARRDFAAIRRWCRENRSPEYAARVTAAVLAAVDRAAQRPEGYAWVGGVHAELADQPRTVRRVVTRPPRHVVYYRHGPAGRRVEILVIRGSGRPPPTPGDLAPDQSAH